MGIYIIEIPDKYKQVVLLSADGELYCKDVAGLMPYKEPDLEQVKEDAFKNGYDAACKDIDIKSKTNAAHRKGLEDAWYAARKIWEYDTTTLREIFGEGIMRMDWFMKFTASEVIEKIRQYEQEKEDDHDRKKVVALADDIGIHKIYALVREIRGE